MEALARNIRTFGTGIEEIETRLQVSLSISNSSINSSQLTIERDAGGYSMEVYVISHRAATVTQRMDRRTHYYISNALEHIDGV